MVREAASMTTRRMRFRQSHYPIRTLSDRYPIRTTGPLVIILTKHRVAWEIEVFYAADLKFDLSRPQGGSAHLARKREPGRDGASVNYGL
jgi:hypothetical protein